MIPPLERGRNIITSNEEIADTLADQHASISRDPHEKSKTGKNRKKKSYHIINYSQAEN